MVNTPGNPNHPVTQAASDQWHKLCAMVMYKLGISRIELSASDVNDFVNSGLVNITIRFTDVITLELVSAEKAAQIAKVEGGLPM